MGLMGSKCSSTELHPQPERGSPPVPTSEILMKHHCIFQAEPAPLHHSWIHSLSSSSSRQHRPDSPGQHLKDAGPVRALQENFHLLHDPSPQHHLVLPAPSLPRVSTEATSTRKSSMMQYFYCAPLDA